MDGTTDDAIVTLLEQGLGIGVEYGLASVKLDDEDTPGVDLAKHPAVTTSNLGANLLRHAGLSLHSLDSVPDFMVDGIPCNLGIVDLKYRPLSLSACAKQLADAVVAGRAQVEGILDGVEGETLVLLRDAKRLNSVLTKLAADLVKGDVGPLPVHDDDVFETTPVDSDSVRLDNLTKNHVLDLLRKEIEVREACRLRKIG